MSMQTKVVGRLYLRKLELSIIYKFAATKVKGYSEELCIRMSEFHQQDAHHAVHLHGFLYLLREEGHISEELAIEPHVLSGFGIQKQNEIKNQEEQKEAFREMCCVFMESLEILETEMCSDIILAMQDDDLNELSKTQLNFQDLQTISEHRISVFKDVHKRIKNMQLYERTKQTLWRCIFCGLTLEDQIAPEACSCCNATQSFMTAGSWGIP